VTVPPTLIVTLEAEPGANVVDESAPFTVKTPRGVEAPVDVTVPVDPIVTFEVAVGLNPVVVITPLTFKIPAGADVVVAVKIPLGTPLKTFVVNPALGLNVVVVISLDPGVIFKDPPVTELAVVILLT